MREYSAARTAVAVTFMITFVTISILICIICAGIGYARLMMTWTSKKTLSAISVGHYAVSMACTLMAHNAHDAQGAQISVSLIEFLLWVGIFIEFGEFKWAPKWIKIPFRIIMWLVRLKSKRSISNENCTQSKTNEDSQNNDEVSNDGEEKCKRYPILNDLREFKQCSELIDHFDSSKEQMNEKTLQITDTMLLSRHVRLLSPPESALQKHSQPLSRKDLQRLTQECIQLDALTYRFNISYELYEEQLETDSIIPSITINNYIDPRYITRRVIGYRLTLKLYTVESSKKNALDELAIDLQHKDAIRHDMNLSGIRFSVSGTIPLDYMAEHFDLSIENIDMIRRLFDEKFYTGFNCCPLQKPLNVSTSLVDLERYYKPLLKKLKDLHGIESNNVELRSFVNVVIDCIINEICLAASAARNNEEYFHLNALLQSVYKSFLLDKQQLLVYFDEIYPTKESCTSKLRNQCNVTKAYPVNWEITIVYRMTISMKNAMNKLYRAFREIFAKKSIASFDKSKMKTEFKKSFTFEFQKIEIRLKLLDSVRKSMEFHLQKNIRICFDIIFSTSFNTGIDVLLSKNSIILRPSFPILSQPSNIELIDRSSDRIIIKWDMENDNHVLGYKVEYRSDRLQQAKWRSFMTDSNDKRAVVDELIPGRYVFRIQAYYGDMFGTPSEQSATISTLEDDEEKSMCQICFQESKDVVIVPCGHTIGTNCAERISGNCPVCREKIIKKTKLFYD